MTTRQILAPTDFSDASRSAIQYAHAIAEHAGARLVCLTVEDPLLSEVLAMQAGKVEARAQTRRELARFVATSLPAAGAGVEIEHEVAAGKPADEILRVARERACDLIVMSAQGATRMRRFFFGSTTERVLRETTGPVLVTPPEGSALHHRDLGHAVRRILVPVDLTGGSVAQLQAARAIAEALRVPLLLAHAIEPLRSPVVDRSSASSIELERKTRAEDAMADLVATMPRRLRLEALVVHGDPAEEIAKVARDRDAGLIVMGMHASPGRHIGSVTYRVLCLTQALVLALPAPQQARDERETADVPVAV